MPGGIHPPKSVIATWPNPNHVNPEERPGVIVPLAIVLSILLLVASAIRLWIRYKVPRSSGWDDVFYALTVPVVFVLTVVVSLATDAHGYNRHIWDNPLATNVTRRKYALVIMTLFSFASCTLRISVLLFYRRLSQRLISPVFIWSVRITIALVGVIGIVYSLKPLFACQPISAFWDQVDVLKLQAGYTYKCFDEGLDIVIASAISTVQDVVTALLPNILLWRLHIKLKQKILLVALFSLAYCAAALGLVRVAVNYHLYYRSYDVTWNAWTSWLLTMVELQIAALCACAPAVKTFLAHYGIFQRLWRVPEVESNDSNQWSWDATKQQSGSSGSQRTGTAFDDELGNLQLCNISIANSKVSTETSNSRTRREMEDRLWPTFQDKVLRNTDLSPTSLSQGTLPTTDSRASIIVNKEFV